MATKSEVLEYVSGSLYCEVGVSSINGVGVKAIKPIPSGSVILKEFDEDVNLIVSHSELIMAGVDDSVRDWLQKRFVYSSTKQKIILTPTSQWHYKLYVNDSGSANVTQNSDGTYGALTNISSGSELVLNFENEFRSASNSL
jgi:hypothetical protein